MTEVADEFRRRADAFERLIVGTPTDRWAAPSPCSGWTARDIVDHIVSSSVRVLREHAGIDDARSFADVAAPLDAFRAARTVVERVLDDPAAPVDAVTHLQWGVGFDLPPHGWDLAKATGQDATIAPEDVEAYWGSGDPEAFEHAFGWQRQRGWFGPPIAVPDDASVEDRLLGRLGRDPYWTAP